MAYYLHHHNGAWNVYSTVVDSPLFSEALTQEELEVWYKAEYGRSGMVGLPQRIARTLEKGTSSHFSNNLRDCLEGNHAGPAGTELPFDEYVAKFLTLPTLKATHV
jgi:hypothetical protein